MIIIETLSLENAENTDIPSHLLSSLSSHMFWVSGVGESAWYMCSLHSKYLTSLKFVSASQPYFALLWTLISSAWIQPRISQGCYLRDPWESDWTKWLWELLSLRSHYFRVKQAAGPFMRQFDSFKFVSSWSQIFLLLMSLVSLEKGSYLFPFHDRVSSKLKSVVI